MKKITIIFMIVICLLISVRASCLAERTISPGEFWNSLTELDGNGVKVSEFIKQAYIKGIGKGISLTVTMIDFNESDREKILFNANFILKYSVEIRKVMDNLYKEPANALIKLDWMCRIAYSKLRGEDVESLIRVGRVLGEILPANF